MPSLSAFSYLQQVPQSSQQSPIPAVRFSRMATQADADGDLRPDGIPPIVFVCNAWTQLIRNVVDVPILGIGQEISGDSSVMKTRRLERKVLGERLWHARFITITFNMRSNLVYLDFLAGTGWWLPRCMESSAVSISCTGRMKSFIP